MVRKPIVGIGVVLILLVFTAIAYVGGLPQSAEAAINQYIDDNLGERIQFEIKEIIDEVESDDGMVLVLYINKLDEFATAIVERKGPYYKLERMDGQRSLTEESNARVDMVRSTYNEGEGHFCYGIVRDNEVSYVEYAGEKMQEISHKGIRYVYASGVGEPVAGLIRSLTLYDANGRVMDYSMYKECMTVGLDEEFNEVSNN